MVDTVIPVATQAAAAGAVTAAATVDPLTGEKVAAQSELNKIEARLSLYLHEVQTRYEADLWKVKSAFSAVKANWGKLIVSHVLAGALGAVGAAIVKHFL